MTLTKKEQDEILRDGVRLPPGVNAFVKTVVWILTPILWLLTRFGFGKRLIARSHGGRSGAISRCQRRGEHDKAVDLAIDALRTYRHRMQELLDTGAPHFRWWWFMRQAVYNLQHSDDAEKWETVIALARDGPEPFEGFEVAYAFHTFARKKLAERDYEAAVEFATLSARADESWPESDLLLGWYELQVGGGDVLAHLRRAVQKDQSVLFRIADDPTFQRHPDLLERLKQTSKYGLTH